MSQYVKLQNKKKFDFIKTIKKHANYYRRNGILFADMSFTHQCYLSQIVQKHDNH